MTNPDDLEAILNANQALRELYDAGLLNGQGATGPAGADGHTWHSRVALDTDSPVAAQSDDLILADAFSGSGVIIVNLPHGPLAGVQVAVFLTSTPDGYVEVDTTDGSLILAGDNDEMTYRFGGQEGEASAQGQCAIFVFNGTAWNVIAQAIPGAVGAVGPTGPAGADGATGGAGPPGPPGPGLPDGIISGGAVGQFDTSPPSIFIQAVLGRANGLEGRVPGNNVLIFPPDTVFDRIDVAVFTNPGVFIGPHGTFDSDTVHGTPSASPVPPAVPPGFIPLAHCLVPANATLSSQIVITDVRSFVGTAVTLPEPFIDPATLTPEQIGLWLIDLGIESAS